MMTSTLRALRAGGFAAGIALAVSFAGVASADPGGDAGSSQDPSTSSQDIAPAVSGSNLLSEQARVDEDALSNDLAKESDSLAQLVAETDSTRSTLDALRSSGTEPSMTDMLQLQLQMNHLNQLSEQSTKAMSESNSAVEVMAYDSTGKGGAKMP